MLPLRLLDAEKTRLLRALCRLQTFSNVYGRIFVYEPPNCEKRTNYAAVYEWSDRIRDIEQTEKWRTFFSTMPPWEFEEFLCVWTWIKTPYVEIFAEIADDVSMYKVNPGLLPYETQELYPHCEWKSDNSSLPSHIRLLQHLTYLEYIGPGYQFCLSCMADLGPRFLYRVLHESYENRRDFVAGNVTSLREDISELWFWDAPWELVSPADKYKRHEQDLRSYLVTLPPSERPNLSYIRYYYGENPIVKVLEEWVTKRAQFLGDRVGLWCISLQFIFFPIQL